MSVEPVEGLHIAIDLLPGRRNAYSEPDRARARGRDGGVRRPHLPLVGGREKWRLVSVEGNYWKI
jgi:hypothetical protein